MWMAHRYSWGNMRACHRACVSIQWGDRSWSDRRVTTTMFLLAMTLPLFSTTSGRIVDRWYAERTVVCWRQHNRPATQATFVKPCILTLESLYIEKGCLCAFTHMQWHNEQHNFTFFKSRECKKQTKTTDWLNYLYPWSWTLLRT
jgi:hypothetical protein